MDSNQHSSPPNPSPEQLPAKKRRNRWSLVRKILIWGIGLTLGLILLFQVPAFQNWIGKLVVNSISETLGTEVRLKRVNLAWLDALSLDGLYVEDKYGDTLLYSNAIRADFNFNPLVLLTRGLEIEELGISDTRFVIRRDVGDKESNLETALEKLFPPKETAAKPLNLNLKRLQLQEITFVQSDSVRGQRMDLDLEEATVRLNNLDLPGKRIELSDVSIFGPHYTLTNFAPNPLEDDNQLDLETIEMMDSISNAVDALDSLKLVVTADKINITDGTFVLNNFRKDAIEKMDISAIDFARLGVSDIDLEISDLLLQQDTFTGQLQHLSLKERSGFELDKLSVTELTIAPTRLIAENIELLTPNSRLSDNLDFKYRRGWGDWNDFPNRVNMRLAFDQSNIAFRDVMYFARTLRNNQFFRDNRNRSLSLDGLVTGRVNSLKGKGLALALDNANYLSGEFALSGITRKGETFLELDLDNAVTDMNSLRRLINGFNPPPAFDRLGTLRFSGSFDGFINDFVAYGNLRTDIGRTQLNMQMNLKPGVAAAEYQGDLLLEAFDLGVFLNKPEFGLVSLSGNIEDGQGLVAETAAASLNAVIDNFTFRDYTYQKAEISGQLNRNFFNGSFGIQDENIDFNFLGELDFRDSIADFDFAAEVARLDLQALNLSKADLVLSGLIDINLLNTRFSDMEGSINIGGLELVKDGEEIYNIDTVSAYSTFDEIGRKVVVLESDVATGRLVGEFDLDQVVGSLKQFMVNNYPGFASRLNLKPPRRISSGNNFSYELNIIDSKGLNYLIASTLGPIRNLVVAGNYNEEEEELGLEIEIPRLEIGKLRINDIILIASSDGPFGEVSIVVDSTYNNNKALLGQVTLLSLLEGDSLQFAIKYASETSNLLDKVDLDGLFYLPDSVNYRVKFDSSRLVLFQDIWEISGNNAITFRQGYIDTRDFSLESGRRRISLQQEGRRGLGLSLQNFELGIIDSVWNYPNLDFSGDFSAQLLVEDVFKLEGISANLRSDTFLMNNEDYGWMRLDATLPNVRGQVNAYMSLNRDTSQLITEAIFNLQDLNEAPESDAERKNYLDLNIAIDGYPLELANYWVGGSVSDIEGEFNAGMQVKGLTKKLDVDGFIAAKNGAFTIDYLKTRYRFEKARVAIDNSLFDASGTVLLDRYGNTARVFGGISHDRLKNLGLAAELYTDRFLALDLKKEDNDLFYGRALGKGRIAFSGNFKQTDIYVRAEVGEQSYLFIPTDQTAESGPISDIRFVNKKIYVEPEEEVVRDATGVSLEMEIIVNEQAQVEIIFDEEIGDLIRGNGRGNLRITVPRDGEMQMFGDYNIVSGNYLFTFYKVVNKLFSVRPGGQVVWSGDPFGAQINLKADYEKLSTPILNFIQEYLVGNANTDLQNAASRATEVDLTLILEGQLLQPDINFDLSFPELDGQLETFANNKRRLLLLDQNELNRQVFGLIVVGQFLPADLSFSTQDVAVNTLSEWLSNYFSLLLNNLLTDTFGEDAFISSFDFDLAYNRYNNGNLSTDGLNSRGDVFEFTIRKNLGNRWTIVNDFSVLSNNQLATSGNSRTFIGNNFALEYAFNDKRTLKFRFYQRIQPDIVSTSRNQVGLGLSWRKEFNSLREFFGKIKREVE